MSEGVPEEDRAAVTRVIGVLTDHTRHTGGYSQEPMYMAALWPWPTEIDGQLDEIVKLVSGFKSEIATVIAHVRNR